MVSEQEIEKEIQEKGLNAPTATPGNVVTDFGNFQLV